jgi:hypothetical protein
LALGSTKTESGRERLQYCTICFAVPAADVSHWEADWDLGLGSIFFLGNGLGSISLGGPTLSPDGSPNLPAAAGGTYPSIISTDILRGHTREKHFKLQYFFVFETKKRKFV